MSTNEIGFIKLTTVCNKFDPADLVFHDNLQLD